MYLVRFLFILIPYGSLVAQVVLPDYHIQNTTEYLNREISRPETDVRVFSNGTGNRIITINGSTSTTTWLCRDSRCRQLPTMKLEDNVRNIGNPRAYAEEVFPQYGDPQPVDVYHVNENRNGVSTRITPIVNEDDIRLRVECTRGQNDFIPLRSERALEGLTFEPLPPTQQPFGAFRDPVTNIVYLLSYERYPNLQGYSRQRYKVFSGQWGSLRLAEFTDPNSPDATYENRRLTMIGSSPLRTALETDAGTISFRGGPDSLGGTTSNVQITINGQTRDLEPVSPWSNAEEYQRNTAGEPTTHFTSSNVENICESLHLPNNGATNDQRSRASEN